MLVTVTIPLSLQYRKKLLNTEIAIRKTGEHFTVQTLIRNTANDFDIRKCYESYKECKQISGRTVRKEVNQQASDDNGQNHTEKLYIQIRVNTTVELALPTLLHNTDVLQKFATQAGAISQTNAHKNLLHQKLKTAAFHALSSYKILKYKNNIKTSDNEACEQEHPGRVTLGTRGASWRAVRIGPLPWRHVVKRVGNANVIPRTLGRHPHT